MSTERTALVIPGPLRARAEIIAAALGEEPEMVLRLALRVGLAELPARLAMPTEELERALHALGRKRRGEQGSGVAKAARPEPEPEPPGEPMALGALLHSSLAQGAEVVHRGDVWEDQPPLWSLAEEPSMAALKRMVASLDDQAGHHIVWVDHQGGVHATCLPPGEAPARWMRANHDRVLFMETYSVGNGYVGPEAAEDERWMGQLYEGLVGRWREIQEAMGPG